MYFIEGAEIGKVDAYMEFSVGDQGKSSELGVFLVCSFNWYILLTWGA